MAEESLVASTRDLPPGSVKKVEVGGNEIALCNVDGRFYAVTNVCPHQGGPLGEGHLKGPWLVCPWHEWPWNVVTGEGPGNPQVKIESYPVRVEGEDIYVTA